MLCNVMVRGKNLTKHYYYIKTYIIFSEHQNIKLKRFLVKETK